MRRYENESRGGSNHWPRILTHKESKKSKAKMSFIGYA